MSHPSSSEMNQDANAKEAQVPMSLLTTTSVAPQSNPVRTFLMLSWHRASQARALQSVQEAQASAIFLQYALLITNKKRADIRFLS
jgi:hypothetical protein